MSSAYPSSLIVLTSPIPGSSPGSSVPLVDETTAAMMPITAPTRPSGMSSSRPHASLLPAPVVVVTGPLTGTARSGLTVATVVAVPYAGRGAPLGSGWGGCRSWV